MAAIDIDTCELLGIQVSSKGISREGLPNEDVRDIYK